MFKVHVAHANLFTPGHCLLPAVIVEAIRQNGALLLTFVDTNADELRHRLPKEPVEQERRETTSDGEKP